MHFAPKSEEEVAAANLFPAGTYDFEIQNAEDAVSKAGNEMIKLTLRVFAPDGSATTVFDYLLESAAYKLRHVSSACGLISQYDKGSLSADDFVGKQGRVKIRIQKDASGQYPDKNSVSDYVIASRSPSSALASNGSRHSDEVPPPIDDDIPF